MNAELRRGMGFGERCCERGRPRAKADESAGAPAHSRTLRDIERAPTELHVVFTGVIIARVFGMSAGSRL